MKPKSFREALLTMTNDLGSWLKKAKNLLQSQTDTPLLEAQVLAAHILQKPRAWVLSHPECPLDPMQLEALDEALTHLSAGIPLPYLTGTQEFFGIPFKVSPAVLIPRPETELLVETALEYLHLHPSARRVVDLGTGSGAIAICIAREIPNAHIIATDISPEALQVARVNARRHQVDRRISFLLADLAYPLNGPLDLVTANLPYVPSIDVKQLTVAKYEPATALDGGPDGLNLIARLLRDLPRLLASPGMALLEIEYRQRKAAIQLAKGFFPLAKIEVRQDYAGNDRLLQIVT